MASAKTSELPTDPSSEERLRVVLIEGEEGDGILVGQLLNESDIEFEWCRTIAEAAPALQRDPACVVLDLHLPDVNGNEAVRSVLRLAPHASVVVLTGEVARDVALHAIAAGAQDVLAKHTVDAPQLAHSVRYAVARTRAAATAARAANQSELRTQESARLERGLLPRPVLHDERLRCVVRYRPGGRRLLLGGDFYDAIETADGWLRATIGDVCGHGPDEAALGVNLRIAWRSLVLAGLDQTEVLAVLDEVLQHERTEPGVFVTLCDIAIGPDRRTLQLAIAGHPGPLMLQPHLHEMHASARGPALGLLPDAHWKIETIDLPERWSLLLYTDGLVEGRANGGTERLGIEGLVEVLRRICDDPDLQSVAEIAIAEAEARHGGPLPDDVALLMLAHDGPAIDPI